MREIIYVAISNCASSNASEHLTWGRLLVVCLPCKGGTHWREFEWGTRGTLQLFRCHKNVNEFPYVLMNKYIFYQIYEVFCFVTTLRTPFSMTLYNNKTIIYNGMLHTSVVIPPHHLSPYEKKSWSNKAALIYNHLPDHLRNDPINDPQDSTGQIAAG